MADKIRVGKHDVAVEFNGGDVVITLGGQSKTVTKPTPEAVALAAREVVANHSAVEQAQVNQRRLIEDTRRHLGQ